MKFVIAYDIFDNKRRRKLYNFLLIYSYSYQKSVFELDVKKKDLFKIINFINDLIEEEDLVAIFKFDEVLYLGNMKEIEFII